MDKSPYSTQITLYLNMIATSRGNGYQRRAEKVVSIERKRLSVFGLQPWPATLSFVMTAFRPICGAVFFMKAASALRKATGSAFADTAR